MGLGIMLTIILLMKGTNGAILPKIALQLTKTEECDGKDKLLLTEDHSATEDVLTYEWVYSATNVFIGTPNKILCQKTSGGFAVNPSYHGKVEYCDTSGIRLKNVSLNDSGYYKLQFLIEKTEHKESQTILLTVSATPTEQCKPVIRNNSGNVLNCTTHCGYLDLQWIWNKTGNVVGNQSVLPISCSWKNEVILCCLQGQAMGCYKGSQYELCTPTIPSSCIENTAGDDGSDIHTVKAPDKSDSNLLGLLTLVIIPVILVIMWIYYRNKINPWIMMCHNKKNKSTQNCDMNTQEEALNLLELKEEIESTPTVEVEEESDSIPNIEMEEEPESTPTVEVVEEPESTPTVEVMEEPESTPTVEVKGEPESTPTVEVMEGPESTPTVEVMEEPESTPTVEVKGEPESTPSVVVKGEPESTPTVEVKGELDFTPTHLFNENACMLKANEAVDCIPTQLSEPEHKKTEVAETTRELQELRDAAICKICFASKMSMFFMPCSHVATCDTCSISLQKCPVCRASIEKKMKIHFDKL